MEEHLQRVEQEAFHVRPRRAHLVGMVHEDPGRVVVQQLVGLLVQLLALGLVRGAAGVTEQPVVRRIVMARGVVGPRPAFGDVPLEEVAQEVIGVAVVARPSGDGKPFPRLVSEPVQVRAHSYWVILMLMPTLARYPCTASPSFAPPMGL